MQIRRWREPADRGEPNEDVGPEGDDFGTWDGSCLGPAAAFGAGGVAGLIAATAVKKEQLRTSVEAFVFV